MTFDYKPFFTKYEALLSVADQVFSRVKQDHAAEVTCKKGCSDCCHALFDLTLIEALYINFHFKKTFSGSRQEQLLQKANRIDRDIHKMKRDAVKALEAGKSEDDVITKMGLKRARCPLLNDMQKCDLYDFRPLTCRLYGIPLSIAGAGRTCTLSNFKSGESYPTVNIDVLQEKLYALSAELVTALKTQFKDLATILVPVSMALLTDYDQRYLGISDDDDVIPGVNGEEK